MLDKIVLLPYYIVLKTRNFLYDKGVLKSSAAQVPTIGVGNVTAGGTGKTPHTEMIIRMLLESYEWGNRNIAVLSRGYKRKSKGFQQVPVNGNAAMFGDEPVQIKKRFPQITVAVCKNRVNGCDFLCNPRKLQDKKMRDGRKCYDKDFPASDLIIMDDSFQHRKIKASMNIVLVDYNHPVFKDHLLPFGYLRDLPERIYDADVVIVTKCPYSLDNWKKTAFADILGYQDYKTSTSTCTSPKGRRQLLLFTYIKHGEFSPIFEESDMRYKFSKRLILFSGIAHDTPLQDYLSDTYKIVRRFSFPDHHKFGWSDFNKILKAVHQYPTAAIATTEKDMQRVLDYSAIDPELKKRMFMIPIEVDFMTDSEREIFRQKLLDAGRAEQS